jgi:hypothetical protein
VKTSKPKTPKGAKFLRKIAVILDAKPKFHGSADINRIEHREMVEKQMKLNKN